MPPCSPGLLGKDVANTHSAGLPACDGHGAADGQDLAGAEWDHLRQGGKEGRFVAGWHEESMSHVGLWPSSHASSAHGCIHAAPGIMPPSKTDLPIFPGHELRCGHAATWLTHCHMRHAQLVLRQACRVACMFSSRAQAWVPGGLALGATGAGTLFTTTTGLATGTTCILYCG